jgi:hypothetical protein
MRTLASLMAFSQSAQFFYFYFQFVILHLLIYVYTLFHHMFSCCPLSQLS